MKKYVLWVLQEKNILRLGGITYLILNDLLFGLFDWFALRVESRTLLFDSHLLLGDSVVGLEAEVLALPPLFFLLAQYVFPDAEDLNFAL